MQCRRHAISTPSSISANCGVDNSCVTERERCPHPGCCRRQFVARAIEVIGPSDAAELRAMAPCRSTVRTRCWHGCWHRPPVTRRLEKRLADRRGNPAGRFGRLALNAASMRPRLIAAEIENYGALEREVIGASMRPRLIAAESDTFRNDLWSGRDEVLVRTGGEGGIARGPRAARPSPKPRDRRAMRGVQPAEAG